MTQQEAEERERVETIFRRAFASRGYEPNAGMPSGETVQILKVVSWDDLEKALAEDGISDDMIAETIQLLESRSVNGVRAKLTVTFYRDAEARQQS